MHNRLWHKIEHQRSNTGTTHSTTSGAVGCTGNREKLSRSCHGDATLCSSLCFVGASEEFDQEYLRNESIVDSTSLHHGHANAETTRQQSEMFLDRARDSTRDASWYSSSSLDAFQTLCSVVSLSQSHEKFWRYAYLDVCSYCSHCRCCRSKNCVWCSLKTFASHLR